MSVRNKPTVNQYHIARAQVVSLLYMQAFGIHMSNDIEILIRKYALQNAVFFKGKANPKSIVGKVLGECQEWRAKVPELNEIVNSVVSDVNAMALEDQKRALEELDPSLLVKEKKESEAA